MCQGKLSAGLMAGRHPLDFVHLHLGTLDWCSTLLAWVSTWSPLPVTVLQPDDWFNPTFVGGPFLWAPPPTAADVALEQLYTACHKDPTSVHIFISPRLFTHPWRKQLGKVSDYVFVPPLTLPWWTHSQHKPLVVGLVFSFSSRVPYQFK